MLYKKMVAIDRFLCRLEADLERGRHVRVLPEDLVRAVLAKLGQTESVGEEIEGVVALVARHYEWVPV